MKVSLLTSSRADLGIYMPLIRVLSTSPEVELEIIAFGTHASTEHGNTLVELDALPEEPVILPNLIAGDRSQEISMAMGRTMTQFAKVWSDHTTDLIICLGDRFEMFAAVSAVVPFGIPIAHLHGGETTLGAMDDAFRNSITHMAHLHFTCTEHYRARVVTMLGNEHGVFNTGALSIDVLKEMEFVPLRELSKMVDLDLERPTALVTYHPETRSTDQQEDLREFLAALESLSQGTQILITLPNVDTHHRSIRNGLQEFAARTEGVVAHNNLGSRNYLSCMKVCTFMLGNTSSGYVEAAFFGKPVIDVGERQTGRYVTPNITRVPVKEKEILGAVEASLRTPVKMDGYPYGDGNAAERMLKYIVAFE